MVGNLPGAAFESSPASACKQSLWLLMQAGLQIGQARHIDPVDPVARSLPVEAIEGGATKATVSIVADHATNIGNR